MPTTFTTVAEVPLIYRGNFYLSPSIFYYSVDSKEINKLVLMNFILKDHKLLGYKEQLHMIWEYH